MRTRRPPAFARWRILCQGPGERYLSIRSRPKTKFERAAEKRYPDAHAKEQWVKDAPHFDELVVHNLDLHLERMSNDTLWMGIGDVDFAVWRDRRTGKTCVRITEGVYDPATGDIHPHGWTPKKARRAK